MYCESVTGVILAGGKRETIPKIELHRPSLGKPLVFPEDSNIIAVITDKPDSLNTDLAVMALGDVHSILAFIIKYLREPCI